MVRTTQDPLPRGARDGFRYAVGSLVPGPASGLTGGRPRRSAVFSAAHIGPKIAAMTLGASSAISAVASNALAVRIHRFRASTTAEPPSTTDGVAWIRARWKEER